MKPKPSKLDMDAIAKLLGVSKTTVHYAIRNTGRLSDETRKRVLKMVEAKGYRPDGLARSFRRRRSDTLGIVLVTLTNSFHAHLLEGAEMVAQQHKHTVLPWFAAPMAAPTWSGSWSRSCWKRGLRE